MSKRQNVTERIDCDTERLYGDLDTTIAYLIEVKAIHPTARLDYEDMEICFAWSRDETDAEYQRRIEAEKKQAARWAKELEERKAKEKRREEWEKLNREFGR